MAVIVGCIEMLGLAEGMNDTDGAEDASANVAVSVAETLSLSAMSDPSGWTGFAVVVTSGDRSVVEVGTE